MVGHDQALLLETKFKNSFLLCRQLPFQYIIHVITNTSRETLTLALTGRSLSDMLAQITQSCLCSQQPYGSLWGFLVMAWMVFHISPNAFLQLLPLVFCFVIVLALFLGERQPLEVYNRIYKNLQNPKILSLGITTISYELIFHLHMGQHPMTVNSPYPCHNFSNCGELLLKNGL